MRLLRLLGKWFFGPNPAAAVPKWLGRKVRLRWKRLPRPPVSAREARFWAWVRSTTRAKHNRVKRWRAKKGYR